MFRISTVLVCLAFFSPLSNAKNCWAHFLSDRTSPRISIPLNYRVTPWALRDSEIPPAFAQVDLPFDEFDQALWIDSQNNGHVEVARLTAFDGLGKVLFAGKLIVGLEYEIPGPNISNAMIDFVASTKSIGGIARVQFAHTHPRRAWRWTGVLPSFNDKALSHLDVRGAVQLRDVLDRTEHLRSVLFEMTAISIPLNMLGSRAQRPFKSAILGLPISLGR